MIRLIGFFIGLGFAVMALWAFGSGASAVIGQGFLVERTAEHEFHKHPKDLHLASDGPFGKWDLQQLQRGYQVYKEVCSACHSLKYVAFRDLAQLGYSEAEVKAEAASWTVPGVDPVTGETNTRPGTPTDYFPSPFANDIAARAANNNAIPPDLSLMAKARHDGPAYIYSLLTGYGDPPAGLTVAPGQYFNHYMAGDVSGAWSGPKDKVPHGGFLAMGFQLPEGRVTFDDGTKATTDQMAHDVSTYLAWAAEPHAEERKETGLAVMIYLIIFAGIMYVSYRRIWRNVAH